MRPAPHDGHRLEAAVRVLREAGHDLAVVHAPAVLARRSPGRGRGPRATPPGPAARCRAGYASSWCTQNRNGSRVFHGNPSGSMASTAFGRFTSSCGMEAFSLGLLGLEAGAAVASSVQPVAAAAPVATISFSASLRVTSLMAFQPKAPAALRQPRRYGAPPSMSIAFGSQSTIGRAARPSYPSPSMSGSAQCVAASPGMANPQRPSMRQQASRRVSLMA